MTVFGGFDSHPRHSPKKGQKNRSCSTPWIPGRSAKVRNEKKQQGRNKMKTTKQQPSVILTMIRDGEYEYYETAMFVLEENESEIDILRKTIGEDVIDEEGYGYTIEGDYRIFEVYSVKKVKSENDYMTLRRYI